MRDQPYNFVNFASQPLHSQVHLLAGQPCQNPTSTARLWLPITATQDMNLARLMLQVICTSKEGQDCQFCVVTIPAVTCSGSLAFGLVAQG